MPDILNASGDPWQNLMAFGLATMAAGGQPGANFLGSIGQGGLQALQLGQQNQLKQAQLALLGQDYQAKQIQNQLSGLTLQGYKNLQSQFGGSPVTPQTVGLNAGSASAAPTEPTQLPSYFDRVPQLETGSNPNPNPNPDSTAEGINQITTPTMARITAKYPDITDKNDPRALYALTAENAKTLAPQLGRAPTNSEMYMAHFLGAGGAAKMIAAPGDAVASDYADPATTQANPTMFSANGHALTVDQFRGNFDQKLAGTRPLFGAPQGSQIAQAAPSDQQQPLFNPAQLFRQYQTYAATPGFQGLAQQTLSLLEKGLPPGYRVTAQGIAVDPNYVSGQGAIKGAEATAEAVQKLFVEQNSPKTLRGPGSGYYNPLTREFVQIPNEIPVVDPKTGASYRQFVPLGVEHTTPGTGVSAGQPPSAGAPQGSPTNGATGIGASSNPPSAENSVPSGVPGQTLFQTGLPPGQHELIEGAAKNYAEEGRKQYESALSGKAALEFIQRDIDTLGPQGWFAAGQGADARAKFANFINSNAQVAGLGNVFDPTKVAAWEDFKKETTLLGMKGLSALFGGSREAASIVQTSIGAVPNTENSFAGAKLLTSAYQEGFQHEIDQRIFETNWATSHGGNLLGAKEAFNQAYPPAAYSRRAISGVQPYTINSPDEMKRLLPGTRIVTPDGKIRMVPGESGLQLGTPQ